MGLNTTPVVCLIPARGRSKGVYRKNMRTIAGKSLIDFTILAAQHSNYADNVYISSDDATILEHARTLGAIGIARPDEFASDTASAIAVVEHFLSMLPDTLLQEDPYIVYLQPTSPLRTSHHIDDALEQMLAAKGQSLVSVSEVQKSPFKMFTLDEKGRLQSLFDEKLSNARRQDLPEVFAPNGAIYVFRASEFKSRGGFPSNGSIPFVMNTEDSLDIDTEDDICRAEIILGGK
ncbi:cytidylyltransferase domain-containing protein [Polynucleobacter sp. MWH-HuK1]|uniref:acylneuraminate cytidylyltransferase family protein n=1 Tax=Polynucleobacter sp. MWH-HuK1 TaxID=1743158 RepID=UPI0021028025|nr:acylneuraminate cytidylyltransferase family protein [Polynucleobacter sp. MWH-HuK1]